MGHARTSKRTILALEKARAAADLRVKGHTLQEIADDLGYAHRKSAQKAIERYYRELLPPPDVETTRRILTDRLDRVHKRLDGIVQGDDASLAIDAAAKITRNADAQSRIAGVVKVTPPIVVPVVTNTAGDISKLTPDEVWQLRELQKKMGALPEEPKP